MGEIAEYYMDQEIDRAMRECDGDMRFYDGPVTDELILAYPEVDLVGNQRRREECERESIRERRAEGLRTGRFWVNENGDTILLKDISRVYARNILNVLTDKARQGRLVSKLKAIANA